MAVWTDKVTGDLIVAADPNTLADALGATYNIGVDATLKQLASYHAASPLGSHLGRIDTTDLVDAAVSHAKLAAKSLATRQATAPAAGNAGYLFIDTTNNKTYCDSEGSWQELIIGTDNLVNLGVTEGKIGANAVTNAKLAGMARGTLKVGNAAGAASDLALGPAGKVLQSNGSDPAWVTVSGDATLASGGVLTIANGAINKAKLADDVLSGAGSSVPGAAKAGYLYHYATQLALYRDNGVSVDPLDLTGNVKRVLWSESAASAADGANAAALPEIGCTGNGNTTIRVRVPVMKEAGVLQVRFRGQYYSTGTGSDDPFLDTYMPDGPLTSAPFTPTTYNAWTDFAESDGVGQGLATFSLGQLLEIQLRCRSVAGQSSTIKVRRLQAIAYYA